VAIFGVFILFNIYLRRIMMKRMGGGGGNNNDSKLKYYCMSCEAQHKQAECPKCGSKMKRIGF